MLLDPDSIFMFWSNANDCTCLMIYLFRECLVNKSNYGILHQLPAISNPNSKHSLLCIGKRCYLMDILLSCFGLIYMTAHAQSSIISTMQYKQIALWLLYMHINVTFNFLSITNLISVRCM